MSNLRNDPKLRKVYLSYHNDGVLDLFIGWCVFLAGLMLFTEMFWMVGVYAALVAPMLWSFKETVTVPRLHRNELDPAAGRRSGTLPAALIAGLVGLTVLGLVLLVLFLGQPLIAGLGSALPTIAAGIAIAAILGAFLLLGRTFRTPRWYVYGGLAIILIALARVVGIDLPWVIMAVGALMALTGAIYLLRFLRSHPLLPLGQRPEW